MVQGVVKVGAAGSGAAPGVDTESVADLDMATQRGPGESSGWVLRVWSPRPVVDVLGVSSGKVSHDAGPRHPSFTSDVATCSTG
jgi:hypothetical protein